MQSGTLTVANSTVSGNSAGYEGGGIRSAAAANVNVTNTTISGNYAQFVGGHHAGTKGGLTNLANVLFLGNADADNAGSELYSSGTLNFNGLNIVGSSTTEFNASVSANVTNASPSVVFASTVTSNGVDAGVLADNGGPVKTIALQANAVNPAFNTGDASFLDESTLGRDLNGDGDQLDTIATDANGLARVTDGGLELGAVEAVQVPEAASLIVTTASDVVDQFDEETSLREAIQHINDGTLSGTIKFDAGLAGSTFFLYGGALSVTGDVNIDGDTDSDSFSDITLDGVLSTGIFEVTGGTSVLENLRLQSGSAAYGGALNIAGTGTDVTLDGVDLNTNFSSDLGGAIFQSAGTSLTLTNSGVVYNGAGLGGGGIYSQGDLTVVNTTLQGNNVSAGTGGAGAFVTGTSSFTNATFAANNASGSFSLGGALFNSGDLTLTNSTLSGNSAGYGAGIYQNTTATLTNSIVLGNNARTGGEIDGFGTTTLVEGNILGTNVYSGATDVGDTTVAEVFQYVGGNGGGQYSFNGGNFQTIALRADVTNPALDVGTSPAGIATDAIGNSRDIDLPGISNGGTVDAGALEVQNVQEAPSLIVTTTADIEDAFDGETSLREAIGHVNAGTLSGTITFDSGTGEAFESGGTITLGGTQLTLTSDVLIDGDVDGDGSPNVTVDAGDLSRVFGAYSGTSTLQSLTISGGDNSSFGGGVYVATGATLTLDRAVVQDNAATAGAGLFNNGGTLTLLDSLVTDNSTNGGSGGGIFSNSNGATTLTNTTLEGNVAGANGGAIFGQSSTIELVNVTATGNSAGDQGGATFTDAGSLGLTNTLVIGNSQSSGSSVSAINTVLDINNALLVGNSVDIFEAVDLTTGGGLLADNGGPVQTVALLVDPANAAAEAGDATLLNEATAGFDLNGDGDLLDTIATDAEGNTRIVGTIDLGATEIQQILGSVGGDTLTGSGNADTFVTGTGVDVVISGDGDDSINAGADDDAVAGGAGNDTISGGSGDDLAVGGTGNDLLYGGDDDDQILPGSGADTVFGGDGEDTVSYVDSSSPLTVDLSNNANNAGDAAGDVIDGVENIVGSSTASNTLTGNSDANTIDGGAADDTLNGGGGNDRLEGNGGADTLDGGAGDDVLVVDSADDVTDQAPGEGYDRVLSTASVTLGDNVEAGNLLGADDLSMTAATTGSWINGNAGNNTLLGQDGADRLDGNAGNDLIDGAGGNDLLEGGSGSDTFVLSDGVDIILDFEDGTDQIDLTGFGLLFSDLSASQAGANVTLGHATGTLVINNVNIADLSAADFIEPAASAPPVVTGTGGNDSLFESAGPLEIQGLGGNDLLGVFNGAATLVGGSGDDQYYVYDAATTITELAGDGTDLVRAQVDFALADNVENGAVLGAGDVDLTGNALANFISGSAGSNVLSGGAGNDRLLGLSGADTLEGGTGNDILQGGTADGAADVFVFSTGDGSDLVTDFELGIDVIDLTATGLQFVDLTISGTTNALIDTGTDLITVNGVSAAQLDSDQFEFALP